MQNKKYISIALLGAITLNTHLVSASSLPSDKFLKPSLYAQMEHQTAINKEYQTYRINQENDARLAEIRAKNQARQATLMSESGNNLSSAPEIKIDESARQAALARPVYRNPITNTKTYSQATTNVVIAPSSTSRTQGNIDMRRVEQAWLGWVNELRANEGLHPYAINDKLNATAQEWSEFSRERGYTTHGRPGDGCVGATNYVCYNFSVIDQWFKDRGVNPAIVGRSKHTENVGYGSFRCNSGDCTDAAIRAIRKTYDFFYSEKSYNGVHYRSMIHSSFKYMGLGFAEKNGTYYLTIHYSNDLK